MLYSNWGPFNFGGWSTVMSSQLSCHKKHNIQIYSFLACIISNYALIIILYSIQKIFPLLKYGLILQETLRKMRLLDDKIIYTFNTSMPTDSFKGQYNETATCKNLYDQVIIGCLEISVKPNQSFSFPPAEHANERNTCRLQLLSHVYCSV